MVERLDLTVYNEAGHGTPGALRVGVELTGVAALVLCADRTQPELCLVQGPGGYFKMNCNLIMN